MQDTPAADSASDPAELAARGTSGHLPPDHGKTLPELPLPAIEGVITTGWIRSPSCVGPVAGVQVLKTKGSHGLLPSPSPPRPDLGQRLCPTIAREEQHQRDWLAEHGRPAAGVCGAGLGIARASWWR